MSDDSREFLVLAVKLLFRGLQAGRIKVDADGAPETVRGLAAVQFDEKGEPLYDTVDLPVRALATLVYEEEAAVLKEEVADREAASPVHGLLGEPVPVSPQILNACAEKGEFTQLAFELYKEAGIVVATCSHLSLGSGACEPSLSRNQAICAGLLVRLTKFMVAVTQLASSDDRGEVITALTRSILESGTNLRFLLRRNEARFFDQFVAFSLGPERELYDIIQRNVSERDGHVLAIEERMLRSIDRTCRLSGANIQDVNPRMGDWGGGLRNRMEALGEGDFYVGAQRIASHAVHGTWVDLLLNHLREADGGFAPDPTWTPVQPQLLLPIARLVLESAEAYVRWFVGDVPEVQPLYQRIGNLCERLALVDAAHEGWLATRVARTRAALPAETPS
jgi:hypothetical protein